MSILFNKKIFISILTLILSITILGTLTVEAEEPCAGQRDTVTGECDTLSEEGEANLDREVDIQRAPTQQEERNLQGAANSLGGQDDDFTIEERIQNERREARSDFTALNPIPGVTDASAARDPSKFFNGMFMYGISIAAFLAVIMIAIGGMQYMSTDAVSGKAEGKERIQYAVMGLLLVLFSWILLRQINPEILNFGFLDSSAKIINLIIYV